VRVFVRPLSIPLGNRDFVASLAGFLVAGGVLFALSIFIELRIAK